ncbi:MAG: hydroxyacid dehydrogenase [Phycisphaeraceae bacterium]|nr:MAG: hydroxyacid dehydrogenase [Phycisphaeraceae bacterium]
MKVLLADAFEKAGLDALASLGYEVQYHPGCGTDAIPKLVAEGTPRVLVVRSTKVPAAGVNAAADAGVGLIVRAGAGVDNIDVGAATMRGVRVANCPGMNSVAVAELTMGLLLECDRRLADQTIAARGGSWNKKEFAKARGLKGMTLGVVGCGAIGRAVIKRAVAFEMDVVAWSRSITPEHARDLGARWGGNDTPALLSLASASHAVSIHLPAAADTNRLIGKTFFDAMRPGSYFINTSRGSIVDEAALRDAVRSKGLRAGLDVFDNQPPAAQAEWKNETAALPGVYCTHHCGASTDQAQEAIARETVRVIQVYAATGRAENCVNPAG